MKPSIDISKHRIGSTLCLLILLMLGYTCSNLEDQEPEIEEIAENPFANHPIVNEWDWVQSFYDRTQTMVTKDSIALSWQQVFTAAGEYRQYFADTLNFSTTYHLEYIPRDPRYPTGDSTLVLKLASSRSYAAFEIREDTLIFDWRFLDGPVDYFAQRH